MDEWWSYSLSDLLLFSPRTYYRLLQRHNETVWPAQILALGAGFSILLLLGRPSERHSRVISAILALLWTWIGWAFLWSRYGTINPAAIYFAWLFTIQAVLLLWYGVLRSHLRFTPERDAWRRLGLCLFVAALAVYPLLGLILGRPWKQAEVFGIFPDPTALATLGLMLRAEGRSRWKLMVIPVLWCAIAGATLWVLARANA
jgi:hypothetical protein